MKYILSIFLILVHFSVNATIQGNEECGLYQEVQEKLEYIGQSSNHLNLFQQYVVGVGASLTIISVAKAIGKSLKDTAKAPIRKTYRATKDLSKGKSKLGKKVISKFGLFGSTVAIGYGIIFEHNYSFGKLIDDLIGAETLADGSIYGQALYYASNPDEFFSSQMREVCPYILGNDPGSIALQKMVVDMNDRLDHFMLTHKIQLKVSDASRDFKIYIDSTKPDDSNEEKQLYK